MAISVFPAGGGEFITNDFVVDMNDTTNNVIDLGRTFAPGSYELTFATGDSSFDIYAVDEDGNSVGYTNDATLTVTAAFASLAILGVSTTEKITFSFAGPTSNPTSEGNAVGAGAYLEGITPSDLPAVDDTATVTGGNFATDVEIYFESGTVSSIAKNITRTDSTELIVTRPDVLDPALDPWDVKAINPGVTPPTGTNAHILAGTVDAGAVPVWTTTSPLVGGTVNQAYAATLVATDADGPVTYAVTAGSLPAGLALNSATGVISGTPTAGGQTFTVEVLDQGGNDNTREFELPVTIAEGGSVQTVGNYTVHVFDSTDDFIAYKELDLEYIVVAGGGAGGNYFGGGGGAGGFRSSISGEQTAGSAVPESAISSFSGTATITVGARGNSNFSNENTNSGSPSSIGSLVTTVGGGEGGSNFTNAETTNGKPGGSGGGGAGFGNNSPGGAGTSGEGFAGGSAIDGVVGGQGGGAGAAGTSDTGRNPSPGIITSVLGSPVEYAQGAGGGAGTFNAPLNGLEASTPGSGGGGGGANNNSVGRNGQNGRVIIRYEV